MHPDDLPARLASTLGHASGEPSIGPAAALPDVVEAENEATLRLLRSCVEAMHLMQARVDDAEDRLLRGSEAGAREMAALRADVATLTGALDASKRRAADGDERVARLESSLQEFRSRHADDVSAARGEAANWRMRVETDAMAFDRLSARLDTLESGLRARLGDTQKALEETEQKLEQRDAENVRLQNETRVVETASDKLRAHMRTLDATIADQRARISCLQNKLATATYAMRFEHMSRSMADGSGSRDILDLASQSLISAA